MWLLHDEGFRLLLEALPDATLAVDRDGRIVAANARVEALLGWAPADLLGRPVEALVPAGRVADHRRLRQRFCEAPHAREMSSSPELVARRADGADIPVHISLSPLPATGGEAGVVVASIRDAREGRQRERVLRAERQRALAMLSSLGVAVLACDADGRVEFANGVAAHLLGTDVGSLHGEPLARALPLADPETGAPLELPPLRGEAHLPLDALWRAEAVLGVAGRPQRILTVTMSPILDDGTPAGAVLALRDVTEESAARRRLVHLASHDALTGLPNRTEFFARLGRVVPRASRRVSHALLYLDLDDFKPINDQYGHPAGDELLRQLTRRVGRELRSRDTFARIGGDEFAILLEHCHLTEALRLAESIRKVVEGFRLPWDGHMLGVGASLGVAAITDPTVEPADYLELADSACYQAKRLGRNRVHAIDADWKRAGQPEARRAAQVDVARALSLRAFRLHAVEQVGLGDGPRGRRRFELLLRLPDERGALIPAGALLPQAERSQLMVAIDEWAVEQACRSLASAARSGEPPVLSLNLGAPSLRDPGFADHVAHQLTQLGVPASSLVFEAPEVAVLANLEDARRTLGALSRLGCGIAIEEVGAGAAGLFALRELPVVLLKVGRPFVDEVAGDPFAQAVLRGLHDAARLLGIRLVATHVATEGALEALRRLGIEYAQGPVIGPPVPLEEALATGGTPRVTRARTG